MSRPPPESLHGVLEIGQADIDGVAKVLDRRTLFRFLNDNDVSEPAQPESRYRQSFYGPYALAVGCGTGALSCALVGAGIGNGDEVTVPGYTYSATAAACLIDGAKPTLAEIDQSLTRDPEYVFRKISPYTKAIITVHMRGSISDLITLRNIANRHNLKLSEDRAQANGSRYQGRSAGSIGDAGAFNLQHYKVITRCVSIGIYQQWDDEHVSEVCMVIAMIQDVFEARGLL